MFASISHTRDFPPAGPAESMTLHSTCMTMASLRYRLLASTKALETLSHRRRSNWNHVTFSRTFSSSMSSFDDMVTTEAMDDAPAVAKMTLHRRPANSLSMGMVVLARRMYDYSLNDCKTHNFTSFFATNRTYALNVGCHKIPGS